MWQLLKKIVPSRNERLLARYGRTVARINRLEDDCAALDDAALRAKKDEFSDRLKGGEAVDSVLPEAFAVVREAAGRALGMRHFDVQLIGGMVLHDGKIAEMRTGEGKTLVATLPAYLNALGGAGVHIITVNDYLARRDAEWMGAVYERLGLTTGVVVGGQKGGERHAAYRADITYGTNNEFGFDYLRDNMVFEAGQRVQRGAHFGIVDEVDSILIDEARTPLIISGPSEGGADVYLKIDRMVRRLRAAADEDSDGDYTIDEKSRQAMLTEDGYQRIEEMLEQEGLLHEGGLYGSANIGLFHHVSTALRAHALFRKNVDYIVRNDSVLIVDEFTGRVMPGRRWSDGLHQAVEAKEGVRIEQENQTLASITFQNYFRLYEKLAGMTGTADTEAFEFQDIYGLEVVVIPTHHPMVRDDQPDLVYMTGDEKFSAIVADIGDCVERRQPVLVGTASIEVSEYLSGLLNDDKIAHQVLNAKHHEAESRIIAQAGRPGTVTIATNMAGRGTDIVLGGSLDAELAAAGEGEGEGDAGAVRGDWQRRHREVVDAGGLRIIGTERHESRRVDNQLRGRSGRQGDPGSSRFYLSLEDSLMRIFASGKVKSMMERLGMEKDEVIEHPWVTRAIENAQKKVEAHNFDIRKHLLEYDDVANEQRQIIYRQRHELIEAQQESVEGGAGVEGGVAAGGGAVAGGVAAADGVDSVDGADGVAAGVDGAAGADAEDSEAEGTMETMLPEIIDAAFDAHIPEYAVDEQWEVAKLETALARDFDLACPVASWLDENPDITRDTIRERIQQQADAAYRDKAAQIGAAQLRLLEDFCMLQILDHHWKEHLVRMDYLRQGISLRSFAQKNPKQEYKREAFQLFGDMFDTIRHEFVSRLMKLKLEEAPPELTPRAAPEDELHLDFLHKPAADALHPQAQPGPQAAAGEAAPEFPPPPPPRPAETQTVRREHPKIGRNDPCFCGSGKKYKRCHGAAR